MQDYLLGGLSGRDDVFHKKNLASSFYRVIDAPHTRPAPTTCSHRIPVFGTQMLRYFPCDLLCSHCRTDHIVVFRYATFCMLAFFDEHFSEVRKELGAFCNWPAVHIHIAVQPGGEYRVRHMVATGISPEDPKRFQLKN